jgi:glucose/arabinose dehydrogenase
VRTYSCLTVCLLVPLLTLAACPAPQPNGPLPDGGLGDAGLDGSTAADAGLDAGTDAGLDAGLDAGTDAGLDAGIDGGSDAGTDAGVDAGSPPVTNFCALPGSVVWDGMSTPTTVPGGATTPDIKWMHLPAGFCGHYFGHVPNARQIRFAPGGELFVASPTTSTTGGGSGGLSAIALLVDDNKDGNADGAPTTFLTGLPSTQGLLFTPGFFYYQDHTKILRIPYAAGQRTAPSPLVPTQMIDVNVYTSGLHWPKTLDIADDGTIYVANGGDQSETCDTTTSVHPFHGGILKIDGSANGAEVSQGFRNPIAVKCQRGHNNCFATELAKDYSASSGGREKLVPIRQGDDWGFPCCATQNLPYSDVMIPVSDCSGVAAESGSFVIGHTPFGFDFSPATWPASWANRVIVALHGVAGSWEGARVAAIATDTATGLPLPATEINGSFVNMPDFATGWADGARLHGRPADVAMAADGRVFIANDTNGDIIWIAPVTPP